MGHAAVFSFRRIWNLEVDAVAAVCMFQVTRMVPGAVPPAALKLAGMSNGVALALRMAVTKSGSESASASSIAATS